MTTLQVLHKGILFVHIYHYQVPTITKYLTLKPWKLADTWRITFIRASAPTNILTSNDVSIISSLSVVSIPRRGRNDVGYHGSEIPTPNIDALAYNGIILNRYYTHPSCTPSRAALLTGKYVSRLGLQGPPLPAAVPLGLNINEKIMPQYFKDLGYSTHLVGKWHVGYYSPEYLPTNRGFDTFFGYHNGFLGYYDGVLYENKVAGLDAWRNTTKAWPEFYNNYLPTLFDQEAVNIIDSHANKGKNDGLFMIVATISPHRGNKKLNLESPPYSFGKRLRNITDCDRRTFADVMIGLDNTVGEVTAALKRNNMINNSIIVFFSDNGAPTFDNVWNYDNYGSNWPLRGEKMSLHEGGVLVPAIIWSSDFTSSASRVNNELFHITDWLPTLLKAAGSDLSHLRNINGINQWDSLMSDNHMSPRDELLVTMEEISKIEAVIKGKWKLLRNYTPTNQFSFTDNYYGQSWRGTIEYNKTEIYNSKTAISLINNHINDKLINKLRNEATIKQFCNFKEKERSLKTDCYNKYCLYNLEKDPCECDDQANNQINVVRQLTLILNKYRKELVPRVNPGIDKRGKPGLSNYWEPWIFTTNLNSLNIKLN